MFGKLRPILRLSVLADPIGFPADPVAAAAAAVAAAVPGLLNISAALQGVHWGIRGRRRKIFYLSYIPMYLRTYC